MRNRLFVAIVFILVSVASFPAHAQQEDCKPEEVRVWMIQRQVGRNRIQPLIAGDTKMTWLEFMLAIQQERRNLEDLKRPSCADGLFMLTTYYYDAIVDYAAFRITGDTKSNDTVIAPRLKHYYDTIDSLYKPLEKIAGVDVMAEAAKILPVPTQQPTPEPLKPIKLEGKKGGIVLGPEDIPSGTYRLVISSKGGVSVKVEAVSGSCIGAYIYLDSSGGTTEEIFSSGGCRALIQIGQTDQPWTVEFRPVQ